LKSGIALGHNQERSPTALDGRIAPCNTERASDIPIHQCIGPFVQP
jgi:hypothetical protein